MEGTGRNPDWEWDEIVLVRDIVIQNGDISSLRITLGSWNCPNCSSG